jgi:hypothetical protein
VTWTRKALSAGALDGRPGNTREDGSTLVDTSATAKCWVASEDFHLSINDEPGFVLDLEDAGEGGDDACR